MAHAAFYIGPVGVLDHDVLPYRKLEERFALDLCAPLQTSLPNQAEQFAAGLNNGPFCRQPGGNYAVIGSGQGGGFQPEALRLALRSCRIDARLGGLLLCLIKCQFLLAYATGGREPLGPVQGRHGLRQCGLCLHQLRIYGLQIRFHGRRIQAGEHLALLHDITDVRQHADQPQAANLGANAGFLPGHDISLRFDLVRPHFDLGSYQ